MKRIIKVVAAAALGTSGSALAQGHSGHVSGEGHGQYQTHCGAGGWDTAGGGIPSGCSTGPAVSSSNTPIGTDLPNAQPGECFARVVIPAVYDDVPQTVTTQDSYDRLSVTEPQFAPDSVNIKVRDEGVRYIVRQPRYETRTEQVLVKPAYERLTVVPAQFDTVSEQVQVGQPRLVWRPGKNLSGVSRTDPNTGAVYCLVEEPGQSVAVHKRVVRVPEQVRSQSVPAQYITVSKQVLTDPGGVDQQVIPAEFRDVPVSRLVQPAGQVAEPVAPLTKTINTRVLRSSERFEWVPVLCNTNSNHTSISRVQNALAHSGHYNGPVDGIAGPQTHAAVRSFQASQGLPSHGNITSDTAQALGLADLVGGSRQVSAPPVPATPTQSAPATATSEQNLPWHQRTRNKIPNRWSAPVQQAAPAPIPAPAELANSPAFTEVSPSAPVLRQRNRLSWAGKTR